MLKTNPDFRLYRIFTDMKQRCYNPKCKAYPRYGGRGIKICEEWKTLSDFRRDMKESYEEHVLKYGERQTTIDRIDPDGDYSKENCRWATYAEQRVNIRNKAVYKATHLITKEEVVFNNLTLFCKEHGCRRQLATKCLQGKISHHHKWKFERLTEKERGKTDVQD